MLADLNALLSLLSFHGLLARPGDYRSYNLCILLWQLDHCLRIVSHHTRHVKYLLTFTYSLTYLLIVMLSWSSCLHLYSHQYNSGVCAAALSVFDLMTSELQSFHWLPFKQRGDWIQDLCYKCFLFLFSTSTSVTKVCSPELAQIYQLFLNFICFFPQQKMFSDKDFSFTDYKSFYLVKSCYQFTSFTVTLQGTNQEGNAKSFHSWLFNAYLP